MGRRFSDPTPVSHQLAKIAVAALLMFVAFKWFDREFCSDDPICLKWECEDGNDTSCEAWKDFCEDSPDFEACSSI